MILAVRHLPFPLLMLKFFNLEIIYTSPEAYEDWLPVLLEISDRLAVIALDEAVRVFIIFSVLSLPL